MSRCLGWISAFIICAVGADGLGWGQVPRSDQATSQSATPTAAEERQILIKVSDYAARYVDSLPNFICDQTTRQFEAGRKAKKWRQLDSLTAKLVFSNRKEERSLEMVNGKPVSAKRHVRTPLTSEGEFGILLQEIFSAETDTDFSWAGWQTVGDRRLAVMNFSIDKAHSSLKLTGELGSGIAPYRGTVTADPETGEIWKVTDSAYDIPPIVQTESIATTITYGRVSIGDRSFLLPLNAIVLLNTGETNIRNEMSFEAYRKFESDSKITFTAVDSVDASPAHRKAPPEPNF